MATKQRIEEYFDKTNKDGFITFDSLIERVDNLVSVCKPSSEETKRLYDTFSEFWRELGVVPGKKMVKDELVSHWCQFTEQEVKRKASGEETFQRKACAAMFEVIDTNNDGTLSLEELATFLKAWGLDGTLAEKEFKIIDKNKNGKIEEEEYLDYCHNFWLSGDAV